MSSSSPKILVTGASGEIGRLTLQHLLKRGAPASNLIGLVRDPAKAKDLAALGVELRQGDYFDTESLARTFRGVDRVFLTSAVAFSDRKKAHSNAIAAAKANGVKRIVYMPIHHPAGSPYTIKEVTEEDAFTERALIDSGLTYTFVDHPPFLDTLSFFLGPAPLENGISVPSSKGKFTPAARNDLAEAHAAVLLGEGHENKRYNLTGTAAITFADIAEYLSQIHKKPVPFKTITEEQFQTGARAAGLPDPAAEFALGWLRSVEGGEWTETTRDLETLIGHKPQSAFEFFRDNYKPAAAGGASA